MSDWEFLLQKEGDRAWLPLESADVEILEGRYRIVANTHIANTQVQIRITHDSIAEIPPLRRVYKRSSRTHSQGLISIIPFTRLKPGKWEFRCQAKSSTSSKEAKEHIVHLQVLPTEYDASDVSQPPEPQNQELYADVDSEAQLNDLIKNENKSVFSGQIDRDEVAINLEENTDKNNSDLAEVETNKSDEIKLLDAQIQDESKVLFRESEKMENMVDALDIGLESQPNVESENPTHISKLQNTENQSIELTETIINNSSMLGQVKQEQEIELKAKAEIDTETNTQTESSVNYPLELKLEQKSYVAQPGEALIISGQIILDGETQESKSGVDFNQLQSQDTLTKKDSGITEKNIPIVNGSLRIYLRNPQTSKVFIDVEQALPEQLPPIIFSCIINVPENIQTNLILGEIILTDQTNTLANQSFTITTPLQNWLATIDDNFVEDDHQEITPKKVLPARKADQKPPYFQELVEKINQSQPQQKLDLNQSLPLKIYESKSKSVAVEKGSESLKLPAFGNPLPNNMAKDATQINDLLAKSKSTTDDELDDVWRDSEPPQEQKNSPSEIDESDSQSLNQEETLENNQNLVPFPTKLAPRKKEFKALHLEDRFFSRLNALVNDSELLQWMKAASVPTTDETDSSRKLEKRSESKQEAQTEELEDNDSISVVVDDEELKSENYEQINWEAQEFVVEDEESELVSPNQEQQRGFGLENIPQQQDSTHSNRPDILSPQQPLSVPILEVLAQDVIAGKVTKVRVQLPEGLSRIYVKIWVYDRQAQAIVTGPHWLTEFIPNGMGQVEVIADLYIAYGCLEIQFEAIAAEVETNRESRKAVVERLVVPPPPPALPFDDLTQT